jgi:hypothetical protein
MEAMVEAWGEDNNWGIRQVQRAVQTAHPHYFHCATQTENTTHITTTEGRTAVMNDICPQRYSQVGEMAEEAPTQGPDTTSSSAGGDTDECSRTTSGDNDRLCPMGRMSGEQQWENNGQESNSRLRPHILGGGGVRPLRHCCYCEEEGDHYLLGCPVPHTTCFHTSRCKVPVHHPNRGPWCPSPPNPLWP